MSDSFHGRDLFAPVASKLFNNTLNFETCVKEYPVKSSLESNEIQAQLIYFDNFGNAITSINREEINQNTEIKVSDNVISYSRVFSDVPKGHCFWYYNSMELIEIACNQLSAKDKLHLVIGQEIEILI